MKLRWNYEDVKDRYDYIQSFKHSSKLEKLMQEDTLDIYQDIFTIIDKPFIVKFNALINEIKNNIVLSKKALTHLDILFKEIIEARKKDSVEAVNEESIRRNMFDISSRKFDNLPKDVREFLLLTYKFFPYDSGIYWDKEYKLKRLNITDDDLFKSSYRFWNMINPEYRWMLDFLYENSLVHVISKNEDRKQEIANSCFLDSLNNIPYCCILNSHSVNVFSSYNHEFCHAFEYLSCFNVGKQVSLDYRQECNAIFIAFLTNYISLDNDDCLKDFVNYFSDIKENFIFSMLIDRMRKKLNLSNNDLKIIARNNFNLDVKANWFFNKLNVSQQFVYSTSLIIALHLLDVFKSDQEKALYYFDKSLKYNGSNWLEYFKQIGFDYKNHSYPLDLIFSWDDFLESELVRRRIR